MKKITTNYVIAIYIAAILLSAFYLICIENISGASYEFSVGGRDLYFSPFDVVIVSISVLASVLLIISFAAYNRKRNSKMLIVSLAFLMFTVMGILKLLDNFLLRDYTAIGIAIQILEMLVLLSFVLVLFKK
jgi:hypothetical protein